MLRSALGCVALLCLSLALYQKAPSNSSSKKARSEINSEISIPALAKNEISDTPVDNTPDKIALSEPEQETELESEKEDNANVSSDKTQDKTNEKPSSDNKKDQVPDKSDKTASDKASNKSSSSLNQTSKATPSKIDSEKNWRMVTVKKGDTLDKIFKRYGYSKKDLQEILNANPKHQKQLAALKTNQIIKFSLTPTKQVESLTFDLPKGKTLNLAKKSSDSKIEDTLQSKLAHKQDKQTPEKTSAPKLAAVRDPIPAQTSNRPSSSQSTATPLASEKSLVEKQIAFGKGKISDSLFSAAKRAGLDHNVTAQMVEIFGWNIDFSFDLKPNDSFRVLFEEKRQDGERVSTGVVLAAEIINHGKVHRAIRYTDNKTGRTGYFSPDGNGMRQAFLRYPVNFTRISSEFGHRRHPISHRMRHHKGIDYSAPSGTPVQATGDAKVLFVGTRGGYGKVIELAHGARYSTLYAHLSRFAKNLKIGSEVRQGQIIGYVGRTGLATGDHLHYEFRVDGIHRNPHTVDVPKRSLIAETQKVHFLAHAKEMLRLMDVHENKVNVVRNEYPKNK